MEWNLGLSRAVGTWSRALLEAHGSTKIAGAVPVRGLRHTLAIRWFGGPHAYTDVHVSMDFAGTKAQIARPQHVSGLPVTTVAVEAARASSTAYFNLISHPNMAKAEQLEHAQPSKTTAGVVRRARMV